LHQLFARAVLLIVDEAQLPGERVLLVEYEAVLAAPGEVMQPHPQAADQLLLARQDPRFAHRDQAGMRQLAP
jgi:hypothetical protein